MSQNTSPAQTNQVAQRRRIVKVQSSATGKTPTYSVLSTSTIRWAAVFLVLVGIGAGVGLLLAYGHGGEAARNQLDAIKTAGANVVGTGGAGALWLAARRQQAAEISLWQSDRAHQLADLDSAERRVTELYTKAAEQLGSEKAPVRLAGMYAFERLAQNNPNQRQTIVNVICAYLRMPIELPPQTNEDGVSSDFTPSHIDSPSNSYRAGTTHKEPAAPGGQEELQVRITAQRILAAHLSGHTQQDATSSRFWGQMRIDLTGATLYELDFRNCTIFDASFADARFIGGAAFSGTTFQSSVEFGGAEFHGQAWFSGVKFQRGGGFHGATFYGDAIFDDTNFEMTTFTANTYHNMASFCRTKFGPYTSFQESSFNGRVHFCGAHFEEHTTFYRVDFEDDVGFDGTHFEGDVSFTHVTFGSEARFYGTHFYRSANFDDVNFEWHTGFDRAKFYSSVIFENANFLKSLRFDIRAKLDDSEVVSRQWPEAYATADLIEGNPENPASATRWGKLACSPSLAAVSNSAKQQLAQRSTHTAAPQ